MLQRDRKMFKLIGKNYIKRLITLLFISVLLIGCSQSVKEKTSQVVVKEENTQPDKEVQPEEKQKKKLSEMYDWDNADVYKRQVFTPPYHPSSFIAVICCFSFLRDIILCMFSPSKPQE